MTTGLTSHPVLKAVNRPMLFARVERRMLGVIFLLFFSVMFATQSFPIALLVGGGLYIAARRVTAREPQWIAIQLKSLGRPRRFDAGAGKHRAFEVEIR
jgi:type IV secretory pathway VirB3-like protein